LKDDFFGIKSPSQVQCWRVVAADGKSKSDNGEDSNKSKMRIKYMIPGPTWCGKLFHQNLHQLNENT
jgi:hypothetical protein